MEPLDPVRLIVPAVLAFAAAWGLDHMSARKGLTPPGFREPWRRALAVLFLGLALWLGVMSPLSAIGLEVEQDLSQITTPQLFLLHAVMVTTMLVWFLLGFAGVRPARTWPDFAPAPAVEPLLEIPEAAAPPTPLPPAPPPASLGRQLAAQFGFLAPSVPREIGLGVLLGVAAWVVVLVGIVAIALLLMAMGADEALPKAPPALVPWIAGLPIVVRLMISLSAGVVEEWFFRGFLQPRIGIALSTAFFVLAHFSYGQPFMLVGITILSLLYGLLVKWRQNIWPAIAAHVLFDAVQLLVVIPSALNMMEGEGQEAAVFLGFC
ncbi:MAG TPA: CPBP family intramembrane glutamic endopeptidase [Thermoanaerobaculia bacterium]